MERFFRTSASKLILVCSMVLASLSANAATSVSATENSSSTDFKRGYILGGFGAVTSHGQLYSSNTFGTSFSLSLGGFITSRWSAGLFYKGGVSTTADFGMLGGGFYASNISGIETDYSILKKEKHEFRGGLKVGQVSISGINSVIILNFPVLESLI